jgi:hypothetical protein
MLIEKPRRSAPYINSASGFVGLAQLKAAKPDKCMHRTIPWDCSRQKIQEVVSVLPKCLYL